MTKKYPKGITCGNRECKNGMTISTHFDPGEDVPPDTPQEKIHYLNGTSRNICTIHCPTCGHFNICRP